MNRKILAIILAILLLTLCSCGKINPNVKSASSEEMANRTSSATQADSESDVQDVWEFNGIEWQQGELGAVAFIGFSEDVFAEHILAEFDRFDEHYGSFSGGSISVAQTEGNEVYLIIPRWSDTVVTVEEFDEGGAGEQIHSDTATPFLLRCNLSDIHPNTLVTLSSAQGEVSFSPALSLMDGSVELTENGPIRDVTAVCGVGGGPGDSLDKALLGSWQMHRVLEGEALITYIWTFEMDGNVEYNIYWDSDVTESYAGSYIVSDSSDELLPNSFAFNMTLFFLQEGYGELQLDVGDEISGVFTFAFDEPDTLILGYVEGSPVLYLQDSPEYFDYVYERVEMMG